MIRAMTELIALGPREAHLHILRLEKFFEVAEDSLLQRFGGLLTKEELDRVGRPSIESRRREVLLTRMLVRTTLSRYADVDPKDWRFKIGERGRPFIEHPSLDFNLSHTEGMIVCLVAALPGIGVDVEFLPRKNDTGRVADHFFAPQEKAGLPERFFDYWTLKEAYIKARGKGLALPLDGFWFDIFAEEPMISFDERIPDDPSLWRFETVRLSDRHLCSVALPMGPGPRPVLKLFEA
jgi:4'-phosphopantetheinyl transferase